MRGDFCRKLTRARDLKELFALRGNIEIPFSRPIIFLIFSPNEGSVKRSMTNSKTTSKSFRFLGSDSVRKILSVRGDDESRRHRQQG